MSLSQESPEITRGASTYVLETERLILRAPRLEDAKAIAVLANDRRVAENTARIPHPYKLADAELFITSVDKGEGEAAFVVAQRDGAIMGAAGIAKLDGETAEIGYWLGVPYWGKGYATEAARAVIDYAFEELDHATLHAGARVTNPASRRVLEKCGFQWSGVGLYRIRAIRSSAPVDRFRLERRIWASLKSWGRMTAREVA
jgi:RimJ/RimL family protein N-acetyltransferase